VTSGGYSVTDPGFTSFKIQNHIAWLYFVRTAGRVCGKIGGGGGARAEGQTAYMLNKLVIF
jgi:hypothetical protein